MRTSNDGLLDTSAGLMGAAVVVVLAWPARRWAFSPTPSAASGDTRLRA